MVNDDETKDPGDVVLTFGQYYGWPLKKIPRNYLIWAADISLESQPIIKFVRLYLEETRAAYDKAKSELRVTSHIPPWKTKTIGRTPKFFIAQVEGSGNRGTKRKWQRRGKSGN